MDSREGMEGLFPPALPHASLPSGYSSVDTDGTALIINA